MSKSPANKKLFDTRSIERNIKQGLLTRKDVTTHLGALPDVAAKSVTLGEIEDARGGDTPSDDS